MNGLIQRSIEEHFPLEIIYLSKNEELSQRKLIVKEVNGDSIKAYCLLRKEVRTFRLENILSIMPESNRKEWLH
ncbi:MAG: hypothetical protein Q8934_07335 [Bacillota bacterium]|nr:hypothetical protein [Bacillota bacterium]